MKIALLLLFFPVLCQASEFISWVYKDSVASRSDILYEHIQDREGRPVLAYEFQDGADQHDVEGAVRSQALTFCRDHILLGLTSLPKVKWETWVLEEDTEFIYGHLEGQYKSYMRDMAVFNYKKIKAGSKVAVLLSIQCTIPSHIPKKYWQAKGCTDAC